MISLSFVKELGLSAEIPLSGNQNTLRTRMKTLIKVEEAAQFALSIIVYTKLPFVWWVYPVLLLLPDVSMIGYMINAKVGAFTYNVVHHKALAIVVGVVGLFLANNYWLLAGVLLFGHASMDRMFGYGLKYLRGFTFTHLGEVGAPKKSASRESNYSHSAIPTHY